MPERGADQKVMIAIPVLLPGGTEFQTLSLVGVLIDAGYRVTVNCYYEYDPDMVSRFQAAGAEVLLMKRNRADGLGQIFAALVRLFGTLKPDIVHVQYLAPGFVPLVAARCAGIKTVFATLHQPGRGYGWKERFLVRTAARLCRVVSCVSQSVEASWFGGSEVLQPETCDGTRKHYTIYNAVDARKIGQAAATLNREGLQRALGVHGRNVIGVVGRLRQEKGQSTLLAALPAILMALPETVLLVVGDGPDGGILREQAEQAGLAENIVWRGRQSPEEVCRMYGIMDVLVVPSLFEGFGLVAAEAMAAGLPVVASDIDGLREVVADRETGLLVPPGDAQALAAAVVGLVGATDTARAMGCRGRSHVEQLFPVQRFASATLAMYRLARSSESAR